jgi:hypothetical protein
LVAKKKINTLIRTARREQSPTSDRKPIIESPVIEAAREHRPKNVSSKKRAQQQARFFINFQKQ